MGYYELKRKIVQIGYPYQCSTKEIKGMISELQVFYDNLGLEDDTHMSTDTILLIEMGVLELRDRGNRNLTVAIVILSIITTFTAILSVAFEFDFPKALDLLKLFF